MVGLTLTLILLMSPFAGPHLILRLVAITKPFAELYPLFQATNCVSIVDRTFETQKQIET